MFATNYFSVHFAIYTVHCFTLQHTVWQNLKSKNLQSDYRFHKKAENE